MTMTLLDLRQLFDEPLKAMALSSTPILGVKIDSRQVKKGDVFVAIAGETFDGHDFIMQAVDNGAIAVIAARVVSGLQVPQWIVPDTVIALGQIAAYYRDLHPCPAIALTGSNGKTTVKEMIAAILPQPSFATRGNLNNHLGVPLSVLALTSAHRYAVFELGASHAGEIAHTVAMVKPVVTLINNIAPAHIEGFGSIEGVAEAKGEIHQGLLPGGTAIINDDDTFAQFWDSSLIGKKTLHFSLDKPADITAKAISFNSEGCPAFQLSTPQGTEWIELKVPGLHNVRNALAAAACTMALGLSLSEIVAGLSAFGGVAGRMTYRQGKNHALIIDDTYNANLRSALTAIEVLGQRAGRRILVFGDMGELGAMSQQHHQEVGEAARAHGIDRLFTCGVQSQWTTKGFGEPAQHYTSQDSLIEDLLPLLDEHTTVLVKGSRSSAMEYVVRHLLAEA